MEQRSYTVWLSDTNRIASFHSVTGYEEYSFTCHGVSALLAGAGIPVSIKEGHNLFAYNIMW